MNENTKPSLMKKVQNFILKGAPTQTIVFGLVAALAYKMASAFAHLLDWLLYKHFAPSLPKGKVWEPLHQYADKKAEHLEPWLWSVSVIVFFAIALWFLQKPIKKLRRFFLSYRTAVQNLENGKGRQGLIMSISPENFEAVRDFILRKNLTLDEICDGDQIGNFIKEYRKENPKCGNFWAWQQSLRTIRAHINKNRATHLVVLGSDGAGSYNQIDCFIETVKSVLANSDHGRITAYKLPRPVNAYDLVSNEKAFEQAIKLLDKKSSLSPKNISMDFTSGTKIMTVASSMVAVNTDAASVYTYLDRATNTTHVVELDTHIKTSSAVH